LETKFLHTLFTSFSFVAKVNDRLAVWRHDGGEVQNPLSPSLQK